MTGAPSRPTGVLACRPATPADAGVLAEHRVAMFRDMGDLHPDHEVALREASARYFATALERHEYLAWLAERPGAPAPIVGGAGLQLRPLLPRPEPGGTGIQLGREGLVLNVYVEPAWRRRGVARRLMEEVLRWAPANGVVRLVLHASADGRRLYESLGFVATSEMRFAGPLGSPGRPQPVRP